MIVQTWKVSDKEKSRILQLHETATKRLYLKEQSENKHTVDFGSVFPSGKYQLSSEFSSDVNQKVQELVSFIKGKNIKSFSIIINSGESRVKNQDPFGTPGSLAEARAKSLKDYLESVLPRLLNFTPKITISQPVIGTTPYKQGDDINDPRYTREQFVNATIVTDAAPDVTQKSSVGEPIYLNRKIVGLIDTKSRDSKSMTDTGNLDIPRTDVEFKVVKPDSTVVEKIYKVPWQWWNENMITNEISQENYDYIINNFPIS